MKKLSTNECKRLRRIGHLLQPVVIVGNNGLTDGLIEETKRALDDHELIKVKIRGEDRDLRGIVIDSLLEATGAQMVQRIGKVILIVKMAQQQNHHLSNIIRFAHLRD